MSRPAVLGRPRSTVTAAGRRSGRELKLCRPCVPRLGDLQRRGRDLRRRPSDPEAEPAGAASEHVQLGLDGDRLAGREGLVRDEAATTSVGVGFDPALVDARHRADDLQRPDPTGGDPAESDLRARQVVARPRDREDAHGLRLANREAIGGIEDAAARGQRRRDLGGVAGSAGRVGREQGCDDEGRQQATADQQHRRWRSMSTCGTHDRTNGYQTGRRRALASS